MTCGNMYGWLESGGSIYQQFDFSTQYDIVLRTCTLSNKILIGNSNKGAAGLYIYGNNVGIHKVPLSNALDISGSMLIDSLITISNPIITPSLDMPSYITISSSNISYSLSNQQNTYMDTSGVIASKMLVSSNLQQYYETLLNVYITSSIPNSFMNPIDNSLTLGYEFQIPVSYSVNFIIGTVFSINYIYYKVINTQSDATYLYLYVTNVLPDQSYLSAPFTATFNDINIYQDFAGSGNGFGYTVYDYELFSLTNVQSISTNQTKLVLTNNSSFLQLNSYYHFKTNIGTFALAQQPRFIYKLVGISPTNAVFELPFQCADPLLSIQNTVGISFPTNLYIFAVNTLNFPLNQIMLTSQHSISSSNIAFNNSLLNNSIYNIYCETYIGFNAFVVDTTLYRTYNLANITESNLTLQYIPINLLDNTNIQTDYASITSFPRQLQILPFKLVSYVVLAPQGIDAVTLAGLSIGYSNNNVNSNNELLKVNGCASFMNNVFLYDPNRIPMNMSYYNDEFSIQSNLVQVNTVNSNVYFQNKTIEIACNSNITTTSCIYAGNCNVSFDNVGTIEGSLCIAETFLTPNVTLVLTVNNILSNQVIIHPVTMVVNNNGFKLYLGQDTFVEYFNTDDIIKLNNTDYLVVWSVRFDLVTLSTIIEGILYYNFLPLTLSFNIGDTINICLYTFVKYTNTNTNTNNTELEYVQTTLTVAEHYVASNSIVEILITINDNSSVSLLQTNDHFAIYSAIHDVLSNTPMPFVYRKISLSLNPGGIYLMRLQSLNSKDDVSHYFSVVSAASNQLFIYPLNLYNNDYEIDPHVQIGYFIENGVSGFAVRKSSVLSQYISNTGSFTYPFQNIQFVKGHHTLVSFQIDVNENNLISSMFTSNNNNDSIIVLVPDFFNQNNIVVYSDADLKFRLNGIPFKINTFNQLSLTIIQISSSNLSSNIANAVLNYVDGFAIIYNGLVSVYWHITNVQLIASSQILLTIESATPVIYTVNSCVLIQFVMFNRTSIHGKNGIDDLFRGRVGISMPNVMTEVLTVNGDLSCRSALNMYDQNDSNNTNPLSIICQSNTLHFKVAPTFDHGLNVNTLNINKYGELFTDLVCAKDLKKFKTILNNVSVFYYEINAFNFVINIDASYNSMIQSGDVLDINAVLVVTKTDIINGLLYIYAYSQSTYNCVNQTQIVDIVVYSDILKNINNFLSCKILSRYLDITYLKVNVLIQMYVKSCIIYDYDYFIFSTSNISGIFPNTIWKKIAVKKHNSNQMELTLNNLIPSVIPLSTFSAVQDMFVYPLETHKINNKMEQDLDVNLSFYTDGTNIGISLLNAVYLQEYFNVNTITLNVFEYIEFYDENTNVSLLSFTQDDILQIFRKDVATLIIFFGSALGIPSYSNINIRYKFNFITAPITNCVSLNANMLNVTLQLFDNRFLSNNYGLCWTIGFCASYWNIIQFDKVNNILTLDNLDGTLLASNILNQKCLFFIPFKLLDSHLLNTDNGYIVTTSKMGLNSPDVINETLTVNGNISVNQEIIFKDVVGESKIYSECKEIVINDNSLRFTENSIQANDSLFCKNGITAVNGNLYCSQNDYYTVSNIDPTVDLDYITNLNVGAGFNDSNMISYDYMLSNNLNSNLVYLNTISEWVSVLINNVCVVKKSSKYSVKPNDVLTIRIKNIMYKMIVESILHDDNIALTIQLDNSLTLIPNSYIFILAISRNTVMINYKDMVLRLVNCIQILKSDIDDVKAITNSNATFITNSATTLRTKTVVLL